MGLAPEPKGSPRGPGSANPSVASSSAASSSTSPSSSSSSGLAHYLSHTSGPERLSSGPPSDTSPPSPFPPPLQTGQPKPLNISLPKRNLRLEISEGDSDREEDHMGWWQCEKCDGWWRTTGRVGWEESEFEAECNFENDRWVEICQKCRGHL